LTAAEAGNENRLALCVWKDLGSSDELSGGHACTYPLPGEGDWSLSPLMRYLPVAAARALSLCSEGRAVPCARRGAQRCDQPVQ
jgi:hypothetical protein